MDHITISTEKFKEDFEEHLDLIDNDRILFSGKFGTGKSTFVSSFFKDESNEDLYSVFTLYPVTYSVSYNEDIFELIKYDILFQLLEKVETGELHLIEEDYAKILGIQIRHLKQLDWSSIVFRLLEVLDITGKVKVVEKLISGVKKQYDKYNLFNQDSRELSDIYQFLFTQYSKPGSPKERDLISNLIGELLIRLNPVQESNEGASIKRSAKRQNVLIIDDLDRLDPEHIFRLFNIFSVNFGSAPIFNKFGFDKIIFVCDVDNIRNIYHHKYGYDVDFEGYIDKFYSKYPYRFDTSDLLTAYVATMVEKMQLPQQFMYTGEEKYAVQSQPNYQVLHSILSILILEKKINLRTLLGSTDIPLNLQRFVFLEGGRRDIISNYHILLLLDIFNIIFDSPSEVQKIFESLENKYSQFQFSIANNLSYSTSISTEYKALMNLCLPIMIDGNQIKQWTTDLKPGTSERHSALLPDLGCIVRFTISTKFSEGSGNINLDFEDYMEDHKAGGIPKVSPFKVLNAISKKGISSRSLK